MDIRIITALSEEILLMYIKESNNRSNDR